MPHTDTVGHDALCDSKSTRLERLGFLLLMMMMMMILALWFDKDAEMR